MENLNQTQVGHLILEEYIQEWVCSDALSTVVPDFVKTTSADSWTLSSYLASEIIPLVSRPLELNTDFFLYSLLKNKHRWKELAH